MPTFRLAPIFLALALTGCTGDDARTPSTAEAQRRVLVFTKTTDYRHDSIADGIALVRRLGAADGFAVDASEDAGVFHGDALRRYQAVIFLSTSGDVHGSTKPRWHRRTIEGSPRKPCVRCPVMN